MNNIYCCHVLERKILTIVYFMNKTYLSVVGARMNHLYKVVLLSSQKKY